MTTDPERTVGCPPGGMRLVPAAAAVGEVFFVTALTVVGYKSLKTVEPEGFNVSPGLTMLVVATAMLLAHGRDSVSYGVLSNRWRFGMTMGTALAAAILMSGLIEAALFPIARFNPADIPSSLAVGVASVRVPSYLIIVLRLTRVAWRRTMERVPAACSLALLLGLLIAAPAAVIDRGAPAEQVIGLTASLVLCTALGEELFFRGYVQARLNGVFGRPWRFLGVPFGPGLVVASLLFGMIHVFNPTRPFAGHWQVSWLWGATAFLGGLLYGDLRELTGSLWGGASVHALHGVDRGMFQVFPFK